MTSPDGAASVGQLICSSNSYKFYGPARPSRDEAFNLPTRERNVAQELFTIGYYIFTVDGPRVTVDFYSSSHGLDYGDVDLVKTPAIRAFFKRERSATASMENSSQCPRAAPTRRWRTASRARRLGSSAALNTGSEIDGSRRALVKTVNTGWRARDGESAASHVLRLWGLAHGLSLWDATPTDPLPGEGRTDRTDAYALSMSYVPPPVSLGNGAFGIASRDARGRWVNAVDLNHGGTKRFVVGRWQPSYVLGTYGVDPSTRTAWAVLDHEGEFAVARGIEAAPSR